MGVDPKLLHDQCSRTLDRISFEEARPVLEGKVRDNYVVGDERVIIVSDRISAFDVVIGTVPFKGQVLNQLAAFWFEKTADVVRNHLVGVPDPNVSIVKQCEVLPVEFVYRAYLTGVSKTSIFTAYEKGLRRYCGHDLPDGMRKHQRLDTPLLTPTTKAEKGDHDELSSREELIASGVISAELYDRCAEIGSTLFERGQVWAESRGLILVDTKYEMGLDPQGEVVVVDEIHTPDSSRYWYRDTYAAAFEAGENPKSLDKEYVRRWLVSEGFDGSGEPPALPDEVRCEAAARYIETFELLTGRAFEPDVEPPVERIRSRLERWLR